MKCSECGGQVISMEHAVYRPDGSKSGFYRCQKCGLEKAWFIKGTGEPKIHMGNKEDFNIFHKDSSYTGDKKNG